MLMRDVIVNEIVAMSEPGITTEDEMCQMAMDIAKDMQHQLFVLTELSWRDLEHVRRDLFRSTERKTQ